MVFKGKKHIFFDLDHTLWDFDLNSKLAYQQIFQEEKISLNLDAFIKVYEPLNLEFWRKFRENLITKEELRFQRLKTTFDACNYPTTTEQINKFADMYIAYLPNNNHLFAGCIQLLDQLKPKFKLHLITNGFFDVQHNKINKSGLSKYFDVILTADEAGVKKPDPKIFEIALQKSGARVEESVMIGDSLLADIEGAQNIGMDSIWFKTTNEQTAHDQPYVESLLDIFTYLSE